MSAAALVGRLQMRVSTTSSNGLIAASGDKFLCLHASHDFSPVAVITFLFELQSYGVRSSSSRTIRSSSSLARADKPV